MSTVTYAWGAGPGAPPNPPWPQIRAGLDQNAGTLRSTSALGIVKYGIGGFGSAQFSSAIWKRAAADIFNGQQLLYLRIADIDNYFQSNWDDGRHSVELRSRILGIEVSLYTVALPSNFAVNDSSYMEITAGGIITFKKNAVAFGSFDASLIGGLATGQPGIGMAGSGDPAIQGLYGDWTGGDLGGGGPTLWPLGVT